MLPIACNLWDANVDSLYVIDIAHSGENWFSAKIKIIDGIDHVLKQNLKGLKVIHGRGRDSGHTSIIRDNTVRLLKDEAANNNYKYARDNRTDGASILYFN